VKIDKRIRPVALTGRASDSKSEGWGFKSLLACHIIEAKNENREQNKNSRFRIRFREDS
jgi:hypothetical protein